MDGDKKYRFKYIDYYIYIEMPELTPEKIFNGYRNGELDKPTVIHYLSSIIENESAYLE